MKDKSLDEHEFEVLLGNLQSEDRFVRRKAALVLGQYQEKRAVEALIDLLDDHSTVWDAAGDAAWALGEIGDLRAVEPLIAMLDKQFVAARAIEALGNLHDERAFQALLSYFERSPSSTVATIIGNWGDKRAVEILIAAMNNKNSHVRFFTARALGKLGDNERYLY